MYCRSPSQKGSSKLAWGTILFFIHAHTHAYVYCYSYKGKNICQTNFVQSCLIRTEIVESRFGSKFPKCEKKNREDNPYKRFQLFHRLK